MTSRVAKNPIPLPKGTEVNISAASIDVKGPKGSLSFDIHSKVKINQIENELQVALKNESATENFKFAGTVRAIVNNMVKGVSEGWEKKLILEGTGYRAQVEGKVLNLKVGHSHDDNYNIPEGINIVCPTNKEVTVSGIDKQLVGQVSAEIRAYRPPEPYKGKGIRYVDERIVRKEVKKK